ncbi:MAG: amidophosphoribosyltransferase [Methanosarcinales archaeon]|nr:amidophosphoribosyltransferase [Methanosarcinales archaeon]
MYESCGVVGVIYSDKQSVNAPISIYYALYALQHRGQESTGITVHDGSQVITLKEMGLVTDVYKKYKLKDLKGFVGIGHVRYSTTGESNIENSQPLSVNFQEGTIAIAHNGNLVNSNDLRAEFEAEGQIFLTSSDTEVIARLLVKELLDHDIVSAVDNIIRRLVGSYSLTILINDTLVAIRDPLGLKPLCFGEFDGGYIVASESVAIDTIGGKLIRDVHPGEVIIFKNGRMTSHQICRSKNTAHCVFEYIYFARADSIMDGKLIYQIRTRIGELLVDEHPVDADIISPIPDSGITFAIGYCKKSGVDYMEGLMKNRYIGRTFIMPEQDMREVAVRLKLNIIPQNIVGRSVILIDDSIVRGTTSHRIVDMVRNAGAKQVHMRIGSPPIISPCYLGIDMATRDELVAAHKTVAGVEALINADSLGYISIKGLVEAVGIPEDDLCLGCLTGVYPVEIPGEECKRRQLTLNHF